MSFGEYIDSIEEIDNVARISSETFRRETLIFFHSSSENSTYYQRITELVKNDSSIGCIFVKEKASSKLFVFKNKTLLAKCERIYNTEHFNSIINLILAKVPQPILSQNEISEKAKNFEYALLTDEDNYNETRKIALGLFDTTYSLILINTGRMYENSKHVLYNTRTRSLSTHNSLDEMKEHISDDINVIDYYKLRRTKKNVFAFLEENITDIHIQALNTISSKCKDIICKIIEPCDIGLMCDLLDIESKVNFNRYIIINGKLGVFDVYQYTNMDNLVSQIKGINSKNISSIVKHEILISDNVVALNTESLNDFIEESEFPLILFYSQDTDKTIIDELIAAAQECDYTFGVYDIDLNGKCGGMLIDFETAPCITYMFSNELFTKLELSINRETITDFIHELETAFSIELPHWQETSGERKSVQYSPYIGKRVFNCSLYIHHHSEYNLCTTKTKTIKWNGDGHYYVPIPVYGQIYRGYGMYFGMFYDYIRYDSFYRNLCFSLTHKAKQYIYYFNKNLSSELMDIMSHNPITVHFNTYLDQSM